jgi:hypothetical protein
MRCRVGVVSVLTLILLALPGCCSPEASGHLAVTSHPQETSMWCWAASGQMVMHYLGNNVAQCTQANNEFGRTDCPCQQCSNPVASPPCVIGGWPEFDKYGFTFQRTSDTALTWAQLRGELSSAASKCGATPYAYTWHWPGGGGHVMVARGYQTVNGVNFVEILDPWAPCNGDARLITYDFYVASVGDHTHWDDFWVVRKK